MHTIDLSIIIVSWNVWDLLRGCLQAIERLSRPAGETDAMIRRFGPTGDEHTLEVIVVDSASLDATVAGVGALFPWVRLIPSAENIGFTAGNNDGYSEACGEYIFFLNPDTELTGGATETSSLWTLYQAIRSEPEVGVVGPQLRYGDGSLQSSRRRFPTRWTGFFESTWLGRLWPNNPWVRRLHLADWPDALRQEVDWVVGAAMFCRRAALETIRGAAAGPFDEGFFMYSEELDLCRRLSDAGWRVLYVPEAVVIHYEGRSSEQVPAARHIRFNTSKVGYYTKYYGEGWAEGLRLYLLLEFRLQLWLERLKGWLGHKRALRKARVQAYREVLRSQLRPN
jgi:GT2 family glycosyltransferase